MAVVPHRGATTAVVGRVLVCLLALGGCGGPGPDDAATPAVPTAAPSSGPVGTPSPTGSGAPTPSPEPIPTPTPGPGATPGPDLDPSPSPAPVPTFSPDLGPLPPPGPVPGPEPGPSGPGSTPEPPRPTEPVELRLGAEGPAVVVLQERLLELGYWLPVVDGEFGGGTHHAVVALQKAAGIARDGVVGPVTAAALDEGPRPQPRSSTGTVIEIDRTSQLLLLVTDGELRWTFDTSTGRPGLTTPAGWFRVQRQIDGYRTSHLGVLYRPKYFNAGIAMHGYPSVPPYPASHGCVRVTNPAIDWFWAHDEAPIGRAVWVY